jgi:biotin transport system substrate-specific component
LPSLTTTDITRCALFTALIAVGALVTVPIGPVPFTLQVFAVLLAGIVLGPRFGLLAVTAYLALGLVVPVYAGGASGAGVLIGPTGGYLVGFLPGVVVVGLLAGGDAASLPRLAAAGLAGLLPVYGVGATWLALQLGLSAGEAIALGVLPFVTFDAAKALLAAAAGRALVSRPLGLLAPQRDR